MLARALTGGLVLEGPSHGPCSRLPWLTQESVASHLHSPSSRITTWHSDSSCCPSRLVKPSSMPPDDPPPPTFLCSKCQKPQPVTAWFLFIHVVFLLPQLPLDSWIPFKIYCISKAEQAACVQELSGGCHVSLLCLPYTHAYIFMSLRRKPSVNVVCSCLCAHVWFWLCICMQVEQLWWQSAKVQQQEIIHNCGKVIFCKFVLILMNVHPTGITVV